MARVRDRTPAAQGYSSLAAALAAGLDVRLSSEAHPPPVPSLQTPRVRCRVCTGGMRSGPHNHNHTLPPSPSLWAGRGGAVAGGTGRWWG